jgi:uncharacterized membrane protein YhhN
MGLYLVARKNNDLKRVAIIQPLTTICIIIVALLSLLTPNTHACFTVWIVSALVISLVGDFLNIDMTDQKTVMVGLIIFVFAYLTYPIGITVFNGFHPEDLIVGGISLLVYGGLIFYLWEGLGEMRVAGMVYGLVLVFLVSRAISTFFGDFFSLTQAILLTGGTAMIFLGDVQFAIETFRKPAPPRFLIDLKLVGPLLYAGGQLLMALSPSYFR